MDRLSLAIEVLRGHRGLIALSKEELKTLGVWGPSAEDVLVKDPIEMHTWLTHVVNDELQILFDQVSEEPVWYDKQVFCDGAEVEIKADGKVLRYVLEMGALRRKCHSNDPKEDWLFLCGRPKREK